MRIHHVQVPLVDRQVDGLADRPARVVEVRRGVRELHEVAEVLDRAVAAAVLEIAHERGAVRRGEHRARAADLHRVRRVPRDLGEGAGRGRLYELPCEPAREADTLAVDLCASFLQQRAGVGRLAEVDADLLEDRVGVLLDEREALLGHDLDGGERAGDEGDGLDGGVQAGGLACGTTSAAAAGVGAHSLLLPRGDALVTRRLRRPPVAACALRRGGSVTTAASRS